jgi:hypothetical protein
MRDPGAGDGATAFATGLAEERRRHGVHVERRAAGAPAKRPPPAGGLAPTGGGGPAPRPPPPRVAVVPQKPTGLLPRVAWTCWVLPLRTTERVITSPGLCVAMIFCSWGMSVTF